MIILMLDKLLEERERSFYWLAQQTGIHNSVLSKYRHNQVVAPRLEVLDRICETLGCEPGDILVRVKKTKGKKDSDTATKAATRSARASNQASPKKATGKK